jgi:hypothetical protein
MAFHEISSVVVGSPDSTEIKPQQDESGAGHDGTEMAFLGSMQSPHRSILWHPPVLLAVLALAGASPSLSARTGDAGTFRSLETEVQSAGDQKAAATLRRFLADTEPTNAALATAAAIRGLGGSSASGVLVGELVYTAVSVRPEFVLEIVEAAVCIAPSADGEIVSQAAAAVPDPFEPIRVWPNRKASSFADGKGMVDGKSMIDPKGPIVGGDTVMPIAEAIVQAALRGGATASQAVLMSKVEHSIYRGVVPLFDSVTGRIAMIPRDHDITRTGVNSTTANGLAGSSNYGNEPNRQIPDLILRDRRRVGTPGLGAVSP